nr:RtcB family protein [Meiothermus rufus]
MAPWARPPTSWWAPPRAKRALSSSCHGAGRALSRHQALKRWQGRAVVKELAQRGIIVRSPCG